MTTDRGEPRSTAAFARVAAFTLLALAPALAAVWLVPGFVTQDGPAHLYNAHILARSFDPGSPFRETFAVRWDPLPNWAGHVVLMGLVEMLPHRVADRAFTTLTALVVALGVAWLWHRTSRPGASPLLAAMLAALLGLNVTWLLGFGSFLLGAAFFPITLGLAWAGRDEGWSIRRAGVLAVLMLVGYLGHLVSLGLTVVGLLALEAATPCSARGRRVTTLVGLAPLVPLGAIYLRLTRQGGGFAPEWKHLTSGLDPRAWVAQLTWVDPISLARKDYLPLAETVARWHNLLAPVLWLGLALGLSLAAGVQAGNGPRREPTLRGWWALAVLLLVGGAAGPDTLGAAHGEYLQQRVVLLGLVALVPVLRLDTQTRLGRASAAALTVAFVMQTTLVWDYARFSDRTAGVVLRAGPLVGTHQRIATRLTDIPTPFRANPLLHVDCALGVGTGNVVWSDYETRYYYFPVHLHEGVDALDSLKLERIALSHGPDEAAERLALWTRILEQHASSIDVVLGWQDDPPLDAVTSREFTPLPTTTLSPVRLWRRDAGTRARP